MERQKRARKADPRSVPWRLDGEDDVVAIDTTWGELQRTEAAPGVPTVGELELIDLVEQGAVVVDCRTAGSFGGRTIPGSVNIPHTEMIERRAELDHDRVAILFCNGPQCRSLHTRSGSSWRRAIPPGPSPTTAAACTTGSAWPCRPNREKTERGPSRISQSADRRERH